MPSFGLSTARAEASRKNGARSRSAQNSLEHGVRAQNTWCCRLRMPPPARRSRRRSWTSWPGTARSTSLPDRPACGGVGAGCAVRRADGFPGSHGPPNTLGA